MNASKYKVGAVCVPGLEMELVLRMTLLVIRKPMEVEPPEQEICTDTFSLLSTVIYPEQDHLNLSDVVRSHWLIYFIA